MSNGPGEAGVRSIHSPSLLVLLQVPSFRLRQQEAQMVAGTPHLLHEQITLLVQHRPVGPVGEARRSIIRSEMSPEKRIEAGESRTLEQPGPGPAGHGEERRSCWCSQQKMTFQMQLPDNRNQPPPWS